MPKRTKLFPVAKISMWLKLKLIYWPVCFCLASKQDKKIHKLVKTGEEKIEKSLNMHNLIKLERTVAGMLRLEYGKAAR